MITKIIGWAILIVGFLIFLKASLVHFSLPKTWSKTSKWDSIARFNDLMTLLALWFLFIGLIVTLWGYGALK